MAGCGNQPLGIGGLGGKRFGHDLANDVPGFQRGFRSDQITGFVAAEERKRRAGRLVRILEQRRLVPEEGIGAIHPRATDKDALLDDVRERGDALIERTDGLRQNASRRRRG